MTVGDGSVREESRGAGVPARGFVRVGVAGGIGAGKSAVARAFVRRGCVLSDSDAGAKAALKLAEVKQTLRAWWGDGVFDLAGEVDRASVARVIFADASQRARLEGLIHPILHRQRAELIAQAEREGARGVVIDAPLLFEAGLEKECDAVVFVDTPREVRLRRVSATRGWNEEELARREAAQMPVDEKRRRCGHVIANGDGVSEAMLDAEAERVLGEIERALFAKRG